MVSLITAALAVAPVHAYELDEIPRTVWPEDLGRRVVSPEPWLARDREAATLAARTLWSRSPRGARDERGTVAALVSPALAGPLRTSLETWTADLVHDGYAVIVEEIAGGSAEQLRGHLAELAAADDIDGALLIGDLPFAWYEIDDDYDEYGYTAFPIDLFLMDLDGAWSDADGDGIYDGHAHGDGDTAPEIWIGQLRVTPAMGDAAEVLATYFARNHAFRRGELLPDGRGLVYVDDDWAEWASWYVDELAGAFEPVTSEATPTTTGVDDYLPRLQQAYDNVALYVHSSPDAHFFVRGAYHETMTWADVPPLADALFYNLFACSNANYADDVYMAGVYALQTDGGLIAVGSTKTGSMLQAWTYYWNLALFASFGEAFRAWWREQAPFDFGELCWFYGMTLIGDPTLRRGYPTLAASPAAVVVDTRDREPIEVALTLSNAGLDTLRWSATSDAPWLSVTPATGSLGGGDEALTIAVDPAGLERGYHTAALTLDAPGATNGPLAIDVELGVLEPAQPCATPDPIEVYVVRADGTAEVAIEVRNCADGRMAWSAAADVDWIELSPSDGETEDDAETVTLTITPPGRGRDRLDAALTLTSPDADAPTEVAILVDTGPAWAAPGGCGECGIGDGTARADVAGAAGMGALVVLLGRRRRRGVR